MAEARKGGRKPPGNLEAEQAVLGSMMLREECIYEALEALRGEDFYHQRNRDIFIAMEALMSEGVPIDFIAVTRRLEEEGKLQDGSLEYISSLTSVVPSVANLQHYIGIVQEDSAKRKLIDLGMMVTDESFSGEHSSTEIVGRASDTIYKIAMKEQASGIVSLKEAVQASFLQISRAMKNKGGLMGVATGFPRMDKMLSGLQGGQLIVVAGRPGMGKTSFALNLVEHIGIVDNFPCLVFSLEMSYDQLAARLLCSEAQVDSQAVRSGALNDGMIKKLTDAMKVFSNSPVFIDDTATITATEMLAKAHRMKNQRGLGLIVIDYLQLMQGTGRVENRQQEVSQITRSLKIMAKDLDVPIVLLSQMSRASEKRDKKSRYPMLSDLRESGAIEQDADVVIFLHRDDYYKEDFYGADHQPDQQGMARIIIAKQRNGPTGEVLVKWRPEYTKYEEVDFVHGGDEDEGHGGEFYMDEAPF